MLRKLLAAAGIATAFVMPASAATVTSSPGPYVAPSFEVSYLYDFNSGVSPANFTGGAVVDANVPNQWDRPFQDQTPYFSVGPATTPTATVSLAGLGAVSFIGLYWGSPDTAGDPFQQSLSLLDSAGNAFRTVTASDIGGVLNGDGNDSRNVSIALDASETSQLSAIRFTSFQNSFEFDNLAIGSAVPEPATWLFMISGLMLTASVMRKRRWLRLPSPASFSTQG